MAKIAALYAKFVQQDGRYQVNSAVANVSDAIPARSAVLAVIAQIAAKALSQIWTRRYAYCARVVLGAILSPLTPTRRARTVLRERIPRRPACSHCPGATRVRQGHSRQKLETLTPANARNAHATRSMPSQINQAAAIAPRENSQIARQGKPCAESARQENK